MSHLLHRRFFPLVFPLFGVAVPAAAADWLQFGYDPVHSGNNTAEKGYTTSTGNKLAFPAVTLANQTDSAPILVSAVSTPSGMKDVLLVNSLNGALTAYNAASGATLWSNHPTPAAGTNGTMGSGGVTGAPAVDPSGRPCLEWSQARRPPPLNPACR